MNPLNPVILCVDDEEANLKLLEKLLVPRGYVVVSAANGKDALLKIKSQAIDLVLLDVIMPGMNGFEVCRQIKEDQKLRNIPVIMITASIVKQDRILGIEAGAEEFLSKPFDLAEVLARIKMLLKMKRVDDERKLAESQKEDALAALQKSHDELDRRVRERTVELAKTNEMLQADITERKRVESQREAALDALRSEQIMLARTEGITHIGSWKWDITTDTVIWSDELFRIFQRDPRDGAPSFAEHPAFYYPDDMARLRQAVEAAVADGTPYELELRAIRKDGETRMCVARGVAEMELGGRTIHLFGSLQDITEHKQAEETQRLQSEILTNMSEGVNLVRASDMKIIYTNPRFDDLFGYGQGELIGKSVAILNEDTSEKTAQEIADSIEKAVIEKEEFLSEILFRRKEGSSFWCLIHVSAYQHPEYGQVYISVHSDITERKRAEKALRESEDRYRSLYVDSRDAIMILSPGRGFISGNPAAIKLFACRDEQDFTTHSPASLSPEYQPDGVRSMDKSHEIMRLALEKGSHFFEWMHRRGDGTDFPATVLLSRLESGGTPLLQAIVRDITDRKQAEDALKESENKYRLLADNVHDVIFVLDMNMKYTYVSPSVKILRGYEPEEVMKQPFSKILTPSSWDLAMKTIAEALELEKTEHREINISRTLQLEMMRKDGTTVWTEVKFSAIRNENQQPVGILGVTRDITERRKAEVILKQSEERYRSIFENAQEGIFRTTPEGKITISNQALANMLGYESSAELMTSITDLARQIYVNPEDRRKLQEMIEEHGFIKGDEIQYYKKDRSIIWGSMNMHAVRDENGQIIHWDGIAADITNRKQAEEDLRKSEENFRLSLDDSPLGVRIVTVEGETLYANQATLKIYGYDRIEELKRTPIKERYTPESYAEFKTRKEKRERGEVGPSEYKISIVKKNGEVRHIQVFRKEIWWNGARQFQIIYQDITERKRSEEALKESEKQFRLLADNSTDVIWTMTLEGNFTYISPSITNLCGYTPQEAMEIPFHKYVVESYVEPAMTEIASQLNKPPSERLQFFQMELQQYCKDGTIKDIEVTVGWLLDDRGDPIGIQGSTRNISSRKRAEEALKESENKYRLLADNVDDVIFVLDINLNFTYVSPSVKILLGYEPEELLKLLAFETMTPSSWDLTTKNLSKIIEIEKSEQGEITKFQMLQLEMRKKDGSTVWIEVKASFIRNENQQPVGIIGVSRDITERKKTEEELKQTLESLRKSFGATIQVMVSAVEMRDPYTAGHQIRVANLACAIATEMGFPQDKIEGIRMAGSIHDIGKLSIPAEILSKPTKLTSIELSLIREHPLSGYEMLKNVESRWPLAQIVYQHHERMDGSGYPRNLKGDEILVEARIMAVADVMEAMASHRPYRPALGIDAALDEIEKNRGILYDDAVADSCLRLFREKGFQFEGNKY